MKKPALFIVTMFLLLSFPLSAQPAFDDDVEDVPVDNIVLVTLLSGALLGMYAISKLNKSNSSTSTE